ncbi:hypothetical protein M8Z33_00385 [Streptomyces sp. ZAF1911]|uniref:hypothetical protein n=1 Tax=Streptomyces sp. ZAF1911 TaxID=2944129 RepID=UPI00237BE782|nr:hypothetical protein [Streptomyces sp. ZAF1911]MDD9375151.1 hypothetical protein [Streptomyces sp. ZAF1911]
MTAYGRPGPQVLYAGIPLVGVTPTVLDAAVIQHAEKHDMGLRFTPTGGVSLDGLNLSLSAAGVGHTSVSEASFYTERWEM